jgi:hypothetical protein
MIAAEIAAEVTRLDRSRLAIFDLISCRDEAS